MQTSDVLNLESYRRDLEPISQNEAHELIERGYMPNSMMVSKNESEFLYRGLPNETKRYRSAYGIITVRFENIQVPVQELNSNITDQWHVRFIERVTKVENN